MAIKYAQAGYPPSLEFPSLPGGLGNVKDQARVYEEAKKQGITLTTFEIDYIGIKDKMIAEKSAASGTQVHQG